MPSENSRPDVAVFIDFENVYVSVRDKLDVNPNFEMIMDRVSDLGRVVIARAYADWYRYPRVTSALYANGIEPMYVPTYYYDRDLGRTGRAIKNSVDMNLCIDAMKTLYTNTNIAKFVLATGDRDFIPLVNSIRQQGKEVIIIGVGGAASAHLAQSADEFIFYEQLIGKKPTSLNQDQPRAKMPEKGREGPEQHTEEAPQARERDRGDRGERGDRDRDRDRDRGERGDRDRDRDRERDAAPAAPVLNTPEPAAAPAAAENGEVYDVLVQAVNLARERGYVCSFGSLKLLMKELMGGDFRESRYKDPAGRPFAKFKDFALEAERRGKVQVFTSGAVNEVFLPGEDPYKLSQFAQDLKEEPAAPAPARETPAADRGDRGGTANGRRRRRRRGGQRTGLPGAEGVGADGELLDDEGEEGYVAPEPPTGLPENGTRSDAVFEELLDRLEAEQARGQALADLDPLTILDEPVAEQTAEPQAAEPELQAAEPVPQAAEPQAAEPTARDHSDDATPVHTGLPFTDEERSLLREIVASAERPPTFVQIHDRLRGARNTAGIPRTNEELRTLIKQAINSGVLERQGKGNRATYRLVSSAEADQTELIAPPVPPVPPVEDDQQAAEPEAAAQAELRLPLADDVTPGADVTELIVAAAVEPAPKKPRSRSRRKPAEAAAEAPVAEAAAEAAAEPAPEPEAPAPEPEEAPAKPARRRRKKAETPEE